MVDLETTGFSPRLFSARLHELIKGRPGGAPASKAALLPALAGMLDGKDELPQALIEVFEDLIRVTSLP